MIVAGGLGLAPLRPAIYQVLANRERYGRVVLLYGTRTPTRHPVPRRSWNAGGGGSMSRSMVTVDHADASWRGDVGVVPKLIGRAGVRSAQHRRHGLRTGGDDAVHRRRAATRRACRSDRIYLSMERNMKCAIGLCGHCQFGPDFICKDGPVMRYDRIAGILTVREI